MYDSALCRIVVEHERAFRYGLNEFIDNRNDIHCVAVAFLVQVNLLHKSFRVVAIYHASPSVLVCRLPYCIDLTKLASSSVHNAILRVNMKFFGSATKQFQCFCRVVFCHSAVCLDSKTVLIEKKLVTFYNNTVYVISSTTCFSARNHSSNKRFVSTRVKRMYSQRLLIFLVKS